MNHYNRLTLEERYQIQALKKSIFNGQGVEIFVGLDLITEKIICIRYC